MAVKIQGGIRKVVPLIDIHDLSDPLRPAIDALESTMYEPLYAQIQKTYSEGYVAAGELIQRNAPRSVLLTGALLTAAVAPVAEDPRIARATKTAIYGLKHTMNGHKNEVQAILRDSYEKGATMPQITARLSHYFEVDKAAVSRFARTATNDIYNRARLDRYEDSGVVDGAVYSAHIDRRTSEICRMLNGTIWALDDPGIRVPPSHFNCRSDILPYWGGIPGKRDFKAQFGAEYVQDAENVATAFRSKYWSPMPRTKASATYQRAYFPKNDIKTITDGLTQVIQEVRKAGGVPDVVGLQRLKDMIRYRKTNAVKSTISDRFGQSLLLDKFEERDVIRAMKALITRTDARLLREAGKRKKLVDAAWKEVTITRKGIAKLDKDILYYRKRMKTDPVNAVSYMKIIKADEKRLKTLKTAEQRRIVEWDNYKAMKPSCTTISLEAEKERYADLLNSFDFR